MNRPVNLALRPVLACLPAWFRFAQCLRRYRDTREAFPHLANATKYATTFFVVLFSTLFNVYRALMWLQSLVMATLPKYEASHQSRNFACAEKQLHMSSLFPARWPRCAQIQRYCSGQSPDVSTVIDAEVNKEEPKEPSNLPDITRAEEAGYYYFAILTDLALRFGWTLSVSLTELGVIHSDLMVTILAPLEVFRRFVWNFFRLENEHLNNCGKFRAVRDISVAPIDAGNQALLVRMMDEPCGVVNRGGRRELRKRANK
ncbi:hypothetical protein HPB50_006501 [Hyalomma asiaticum]|uniref:Uncharacterized protein n=1 Tax=Hyalomma asiaticum TaxID=266040 RepID=A0ACB7TG05_HYAAI|nr:hypothetical protein HPB50_006501 [Hyalomma asiaticum]